MIEARRSPIIVPCNGVSGLRVATLFAVHGARALLLTTSGMVTVRLSTYSFVTGSACKGQTRSEGATRGTAHMTIVALL